MSQVKVFSMEEVAKHTTVNDLWVIIAGKVYDLTSFVSEHPGGEEILVDEGGRDATSAFEDIGHSEDARALLATFYIGELSKKGSSSIPQEKKEATSSKLTTTPASEKSNTVGLATVLILSVLGLYLTYYLKK